MVRNTISRTVYWLFHRQQLTTLRSLFKTYVFVFVVWGLYRLWFRLPIWVEEGILKALVFGLPVMIGVGGLHKKAFSRLGIRGKNLFESVYLGLGLGIILGVVGQLTNIIRNGGLFLSPYILPAQVGGFLLLGLITAFWEELFFAGFMLPRLASVMDEWKAVTTTALLFALLHLPAMVFVQKVAFVDLVIGFGLLATLGAGNGVLQLRLKNLIAPILAHLVWGTTVYLFR